MSHTILPGEAFPYIGVSTSLNAESAFGTLAGRYVLLCIYGHANLPQAQQALQALKSKIHLHDWEHRAFALVCNNPADKADPLVNLFARQALAIWDFDCKAVNAWGVVRKGQNGDELQLGFILLDPNLRVVKTWTLSAYQDVLEEFEKLPHPDLYAGVPLHAPVLVVPRVFEPEFCQRLIQYYKDTGSEESGVGRDICGKTENILVPDFKRRRDCFIEDSQLRAEVDFRISRRLLPQIKKVFQFQVDHLERYLVASYDATSGGFFKPHRDDTALGTQHRRFACTLNLNADQYAGGDLRFPEFGSHTYRAPTGGAVVFSCSLLHEALPVTQGTRFVFLPFMYDESSSVQRGKTLDLIGDSVKTGKAIAAT
jgi:hypothetical protein